MERTWLTALFLHVTVLQLPTTSNATVPFPLNRFGCISLLPAANVVVSQSILSRWFYSISPFVPRSISDQRLPPGSPRQPSESHSHSTPAKTLLLSAVVTVLQALKIIPPLPKTPDRTTNAFAPGVFSSLRSRSKSQPWRPPVSSTKSYPACRTATCPR